MHDLKEWLVSHGQKAFRAKQIWEWIWTKGATTFDEMSNLSKTLRDDLKSDYQFLPIRLNLEQISSDGTMKYRFELHDGHFIESVLIPVEDEGRFTVCVSSQVGCSLTCKFCATGRMKRERNLTPAEIYDQVRLVNIQCQAHYGKAITNIVYMGMGEPLLAYRSVVKSIEHICSPQYGLGMSPRRITISTAGIAKMIRKLADDLPRVNIALSLHAAMDDKRSEMMPINDQNNIEVIMEGLKYFHQNSKAKISYEYIGFNDFNLSQEDADALIALCHDFPVKVNIIQYNPIGDDLFSRAPEVDIDRFSQYLVDHGVRCTVRKSRGKDIDAACGQLANKA